MKLTHTMQDNCFMQPILMLTSSKKLLRNTQNNIWLILLEYLGTAWPSQVDTEINYHEVWLEKTQPKQQMQLLILENILHFVMSVFREPNIVYFFFCHLVCILM